MEARPGTLPGRGRLRCAEAHSLVIPTRKDGEGPLNRSRVTQPEYAMASSPVLFVRRFMCAGNALVRSLGVCAPRDDSNHRDHVKSLGRSRQAGFLPSTQSTSERADILISHLLQTLRHERGTAPAAAITNDRFLDIGNLLLDFQLNDAAAEMPGPLRMVLMPIALFADIDQNCFAAFCLFPRISRRDFRDVLFRLRDQFLKKRLGCSIFTRSATPRSGRAAPLCAPDKIQRKHRRRC